MKLQMVYSCLFHCLPDYQEIMAFSPNPRLLGMSTGSTRCPGAPADGKLSRAALSSLHHISAEEIWNNNRGFMSNLRTTKTTCSRIVCNPPQFMANESHPPRFTQTSTIPLRDEKIIKVWAFPPKNGK